MNNNLDKQKHLYFLSMLLIMFHFACVNEEFDPELLSKEIQTEPSAAVPVGYITLSLDEFLTDSTKPEQLTIDDDGFLTLKFNKQVFSRKASELFEINLVNSSFSKINDSDTILPVNSLVSLNITDTLFIDFELNNKSESVLDSITFDAGALNIDVSPVEEFDWNMEMNFAGLVKNGQTCKASFSSSEADLSIDLSDYTLVLSGTENGNNKLVIIYELTINNSDFDILPGETILDFQFATADLEYYSIFGYLGTRVIEISQQSFDIDFYNKIIDGYFHFENPQLNIIINNSFGVPLSLYFNSFIANTREGEQIEITGSGIPSETNPEEIDYPDLSQVGDSVQDSIFLETSNTNLFTVLENAPQEIQFGLSSILNHETGEIQNFITKNSSYDIDLQLVLPIWGYSDFLLMQDTIDFNISEIYAEDIEQIQRLIFRLNITNGFPVEIDTRVYFADNEYSILDSMFTSTEKIIGASDTDGDGIADPNEDQTVDVELDSERVDKIQDAKYLIMQGRISTTNADSSPPESHKFYSDYKIEAYIGVIADLELNSDDISN